MKSAVPVPRSYSTRTLPVENVTRLPVWLATSGTLGSPASLPCATRRQLCASLPLQLHSCTRAPSALLELLTSTHLPLSGWRRRFQPPAAFSSVNTCAGVPLQLHSWMAVPSLVPLCATSTH